LRGIPYVQIPTTLLAQVDSAVGGKTAIDTKYGKNLVGSFYQPKAVICDVSTLDTLPKRQVKAGYAEMVKYGLINDTKFFEWLEQGGGCSVCNLDNNDNIKKAINMSCKSKAQIVANDEKEKGQRALLNLGHSFGHALEHIASYDGSLLHGEAVAIGMVLAFELSEKMGLCSSDDVARVRTHLNNVGLSCNISGIGNGFNATADEIINAMSYDKKMTRDGLKFILCKGIGKAFVTSDVNLDDVKITIENSINRAGA